MGMLGSIVAGGIGAAAGTQLKSIMDQELEALKSKRFETESRIKNKYAENLLDKQFQNASKLQSMKKGKTVLPGFSDTAYLQAQKESYEKITGLGKDTLEDMWKLDKADNPNAPAKTLDEFTQGLIDSDVSRKVTRFNDQRFGKSPETPNDPGAGKVVGVGKDKTEKNKVLSMFSGSKDHQATADNILKDAKNSGLSANAIEFLKAQIDLAFPDFSFDFRTPQTKLRAGESVPEPLNKAFSNAKGVL